MKLFDLFGWKKVHICQERRRDSRREGVMETGEGGRRNRHRDWEREQMGNWRRRWREMKWDSQRREWKKVCGWGEEKVNTVFVTLQQGERGERERNCQSLYGSLHLMCLSRYDLCSYVLYWSYLIVFLPETIPQGPPLSRWRLQMQMIPHMGTAHGWCTP